MAACTRRSRAIPKHFDRATPVAAGFARAEKSQQKAVVGDVVFGLERYRVNGRYSIPFRSHMILVEK